MDTANRPAHEVTAHHVALMVLRCRNSMQRVALSGGTLMRADTAWLRPGIDWALERGYLQHGTTNASARVWNRFAGECLYLTRAGKAWLRSFGSDFGSGALWSQMRELSISMHKAQVAA